MGLTLQEHISEPRVRFEMEQPIVSRISPHIISLLKQASKHRRVGSFPHPLSASLLIERQEERMRLEKIRVREMELVQQQKLKDDQQFTIVVRSSFGADVSLRVDANITAKRLKEKLEESQGVPSARLRLFFAGREWKNPRKAIDLHVGEGDIILAVLSPLQGATRSGSIALFSDLPHAADSACRKLVSACQRGFVRGLAPQLTLEGSGGSYKLRDENKKVVALFKPEDEEPFAPNNPRGHVGMRGQPGFRRGILSGEAASREIAAYLIDHEGFSGVPFTTKVEACHDAFFTAPSSNAPTSCRVKVGSLQQFVWYDELAGDLAPQSFPVREVHKLGILDLRILNVDRNDANILVQRVPAANGASASLKLVPIDHGYSFPRFLEVGWCDLVWLSWPQAACPFEPDVLEYIARLSPKRDAEMLSSQLNIDPMSLRNVRISTMLLQLGAAEGLTLLEIASLLCRDDLDLDEASALEQAVEQAEALSMSRPVLVRSRSDSNLSRMLEPKSCVEDSAEDYENDMFWLVLERLLHHLVQKQKHGQTRSKLLKQRSMPNSISLFRSESDHDHVVHPMN